MAVLVAKADGQTQPFSSEKLRASLARAGAAPDAAVAIAQDVERGLYSGITTSELYHRAFALLREHRRTAAARYSLKRAVMEFGPSGFPFEEYLADLFRAEGGRSRTDQIVKGACVEHEVDVIVEKDGELPIYVEAKFHNAPNFKTDLKVALYVKARVDDLRALRQGEPLRGLLVTNTKFTDKAVQYATCEGLELLSWSYPQDGNLHDRIEKHHLYPVTALTTLSKREKTALLQDKIVLCSAIAHSGAALARAGVRGRRVEAIIAEAAGLCAAGKDI